MSHPIKVLVVDDSPVVRQAALMLGIPCPAGAEVASPTTFTMTAPSPMRIKAPSPRTTILRLRCSRCSRITSDEVGSPLVILIVLLSFHRF